MWDLKASTLRCNTSKFGAIPKGSLDFQERRNFQKRFKGGWGSSPYQKFILWIFFIFRFRKRWRVTKILQYFFTVMQCSFSAAWNWSSAMQFISMQYSALHCSPVVHWTVVKNAVKQCNAALLYDLVFSLHHFINLVHLHCNVVPFCIAIHCHTICWICEAMA